MGKNLPISLIGFMGTGKTTIGRRVAQILNCPFYDLDELIEQNEGKSIQEIFQTLGESYFRNKETEWLPIILESPSPFVLSTGGGIVLHAENRRLLKQKSFVVCTLAHRNEIIRRLQLEPNKRPLLVGNFSQRVDELLQARGQLYDFAHHKINTDRYEVGECAQRIVEAYLSI